MNQFVKVSAVLTVFCLGHIAKADFTGHWVGSGKMFDSNGYQATCTNISFTVEQTPNQVIVGKGEIDCTNSTSSWTPFVLDIHGNEVWYAGKKVGSMTSNSLDAQYPEPNSSFIENFHVQLVGDKMEFQQVLTDQSTGSLTVQGTLEKR
jgi:hypothetical protein